MHHVVVTPTVWKSTVQLYSQAALTHLPKVAHRSVEEFADSDFGQL